MNKVIGFLLMSITFTAQATDEHTLFGIKIGEKAPAGFIERVTSGSPFLIVAVPTAKTMQNALPDVNVFIFNDSHVVAGLRGDRAFHESASCETAKALVHEQLRMAYPVKYSGSDQKYQFQSKDGKILAGAVCTSIGPFPRLTLEVTDPLLEERMFSTLRHHRDGP